MNKNKINKNIRKVQRASKLREKRPPPFVSTLSFKHKFRFYSATAVSSLPITRLNMLNLYLNTPTATSSVRILAAVRLLSVEAWSPPASLPSTTELDIEWVGSYAPSTIKSDSSMGVLPAHIHTSPPKDSSAAWWSIVGSNESEQLLLLTAAAETVWDVYCELRFVENEGPSAGDVPAGATPSKIYFNYLDGITTTKLAPVGGVSILP
jgi:hypothetical protein